MKRMTEKQHELLDIKIMAENSSEQKKGISPQIKSSLLVTK